MKCEQVHDFHYLLKKDGSDYSMQVMEISGIIVGGKERESIKKEIENATKSYLNFHDETHSKAQQNKLASCLSTSPTGIILGIEQFSIRC